MYHVIRKGDTLWDIAKEYDGVTVDQIILHTLEALAGNLCAARAIKKDRRACKGWKLSADFGDIQSHFFSYKRRSVAPAKKLETKVQNLYT